MEVRSSESSVYTVRAAEDGDLPAIADIYNDVVVNSTATFDLEPWTPEGQQRWLGEHRHPYAVLVAEQADEVVGWASLGSYGSKEAYRFTAEDSVYVRSDMQGGGIGALLLARLLEAAAENGFRTVIARIAAPNPASVRLHRHFGFRRVSVEQDVGYKFERWLDVVVMQKALAE